MDLFRFDINNNEVWKQLNTTKIVCGTLDSIDTDLLINHHATPIYVSKNTTVSYEINFEELSKLKGGINYDK